MSPGEKRARARKIWARTTGGPVEPGATVRVPPACSIFFAIPVAPTGCGPFRSGGTAASMLRVTVQITIAGADEVLTPFRMHVHGQCAYGEVIWMALIFGTLPLTGSNEITIWPLTWTTFPNARPTAL